MESPVWTPTDKEKNFFLKSLSKEKSVLEYGCGKFSFKIAEKSKDLLSVEHQSDWYHKIFNQKPKNLNLALKPPSLSYQEGSGDGTYEQFKDYVDYPIDKGPFDVILIDGRSRVACASKCKLMCHQDTIVFVHDYTGVRDKTLYKMIPKYLNLIDSFGTMAKFTIK